MSDTLVNNWNQVFPFLFFFLSKKKTILERYANNVVKQLFIEQFIEQFETF